MHSRKRSVLIGSLVAFSFQGRSFLEGKESHLSEESVKASVGLSSLSHESSESKGLLVAIASPLVINLGDLDLDGSVVLSSDESVGGRALAGDVEIHNISFVVLHLYYF